LIRMRKGRCPRRGGGCGRVSPLGFGLSETLDSLRERAIASME